MFLALWEELRKLTLASRLVWKFNLYLLLQSVPITINLVNLIPAHDEVYTIKHCAKTYSSVTCDRLEFPVSSTNERHPITVILLSLNLSIIVFIRSISIPLTHISITAYSWIGSGTSIKRWTELNYVMGPNPFFFV